MSEQIMTDAEYRRYVTPYSEESDGVDWTELLGLIEHLSKVLNVPVETDIDSEKNKEREKDLGYRYYDAASEIRLADFLTQLVRTVESLSSLPPQRLLMELMSMVGKSRLTMRSKIVQDVIE